MHAWGVPVQGARSAVSLHADELIGEAGRKESVERDEDYMLRNNRGGRVMCPLRACDNATAICLRHWPVP